MVLILVQQIGLYADSYEEDGNTFLFLSFVFQIIGGFGSGNNGVASMATVVAYAPRHEREKDIGLVETMTGLGFLAGPMWGSFMYYVGGYPAPFGFSGKVSLTPV